MLFAILLSAGLDMSLPEFQPYEDASGNYLVMEYDVSNDDVVVEDVSSGDVNIVDVSDNEKKSEDTSNNDKKVSPDVSSGDTKTKPSESKAPAGDTRGAGDTVTLSVNTLNSLYYGPSTVNSASGYYLGYFYLPEANTYTITFSGINGPTIFFTDSVPVNGVSITNRYANISSPYIFSVDHACYVGFHSYSSINTSANYITYTPNPEPEPEPDPDVSGNINVNIDMDLEETNDKLSSILFVVLLSFLYPIVLSCVKLLKGGDKNV